MTIAAGTSIQEVAAKINAAGVNVSATVVHDDEHNSDVLAFAAKTTGLASEFSIHGLTLAESARWNRLGTDASYIVNGDTDHPYTSPTNVVENAIPGIRLTLKATTSAPVAITVGISRHRPGHGQVEDPGLRQRVQRAESTRSTPHDQLSLKQKRLEAQFAAMESALSQSQSQQAWLTGQLAAQPLVARPTSTLSGSSRSPEGTSVVPIGGSVSTYAPASPAA
jgi:flagellar capping protein FliD